LLFNSSGYKNYIWILGGYPGKTPFSFQKKRSSSSDSLNMKTKQGYCLIAYPQNKLTISDHYIKTQLLAYVLLNQN
jgi:hypothetical protein